MATSLEGCDRSIGFSRAFYFLPFLFLLLPFSLSLSFRVSSLFYLFISSLPFFPTSFNLLWSTFLRASFFFLFFSSFPFFFVSIGNVYFVACTHTRASQRVSINPIFFGSFPSSSVIINAMIIDCDLYVHANFQCCTVLYMLGELILLMLSDFFLLLSTLEIGMEYFESFLRGEDVVLIFHTYGNSYVTFLNI